MLPIEDVMIASSAIVQAIESTAADYAEGDMGDEDDFSSQMVGRIKGRVDDLRTPNTVWSVGAAIDGRSEPLMPSVRLSGRHLTSRGKKSEETLMGADLVIAVDIETPTEVVRKGILIQAKRLDDGKQMDAREYGRLRAQCSDMLDLTSDSFVFLYSPNKVSIVSAASVEASTVRTLHDLAMYAPQVLFEDLFFCWQGDPRLKATTREALAELRALARAKNALLVRARVDRDVPR